MIKDIRRVTRKQYGAEEKIRIVLEGLRGEESIAESLYYNWSKEFLEAGKKRLAPATAHANTKKFSVRCMIERVFAQQKNWFGLFIRTIGIARAEPKLMLAKLAYNSPELPCTPEITANSQIGARSCGIGSRNH